MSIFEVLGKLDKNQKNVYGSLSEEDKKGMNPWMLMRWMSASSTAPEHSLLMTNDLVNVNFSSLRHHPELQWKLLAVSGAGAGTKHYWLAPGKKQTKNKKQQLISDLYPDIARQELETLEHILTEEDIKSLLVEAGYQDKEIKELLK